MPTPLVGGAATALRCYCLPADERIPITRIDYRLCLICAVMIAVMAKNNLHTQTSPYLLQHKDNPVWWQPWGEAAFNLARKQNLPIFLSIGYSSCYWCHVMEQDSFVNDEVADLLNQHFIPIKVDREERPDVDELYMDAVVALTGHGGWPMSVFLTPDLKPFWGGTFFYRAQFMEILEQISNMWRADSDRIYAAAHGISGALSEALVDIKQEDTQLEDQAQFLARYISLHQNRFDPVHGGFGSAPKFPPTIQLRALMRAAAIKGDSDSISIITHTLNQMACGGIYDHLGGGFHRYSTDQAWLVPHFEKMLYDNALLATTYLEGWQLSKNENYKLIAFETLDYLVSQMQADSGGFFAAQDAGEVGSEGEYYVFTQVELNRALSVNELEVLRQVYVVPERPNFEQDKIILTARPELEWSKRSSHEIAPILGKLRKLRATRQVPFTDYKVITSWNGLAISGLAGASRIAPDSKYYSAACTAANQILTRSRLDGVLAHTFSLNQATVPALLEDYAYLIAALIELYQVDFDSNWLEHSNNLLDEAKLRLFDPQKGLFKTSAAPELIRASYDLTDGAQPSAQAVMARNLNLLAKIQDRPELAGQSKQIVATILSSSSDYIGASGSVVSYLLERESPLQSIEVNGSKDLERSEVLRKAGSEFLPGTVIKQISSPDSTWIVRICSENSCSLEISDLETALESIKVISKP